MPTDQPSSETRPRSSANIHLNLEDPGPVEVTVIEDSGTAVLSLGAYPARVAIFFPDLQTMWAALVEAERQAAHLATEPPVDPTVVGDDGGAS